MTAILDLSETNNAGFRPPVMTEAQRDAIVAPGEGLMIFNSDTKTWDMYNGTAWEAMN